MHSTLKSWLAGGLAALVLPAAHAREATADAQAGAIVRAAGTTRGLLLDATIPDPALTIALARGYELSCHRAAGDGGDVARSRAAVEAAGLSARRLRVAAGPLEALAYPNQAFNIGLCAGLPDAGRLREWARIVRPGGWLIFLPASGARATVEAAVVRRHLAAQGGGLWQEPRAVGSFVGATRAATGGTAEWTHVFRDPDNNRYSPDRLIRPPLRPLWYGEPRHPLGDLFLTQAFTAGGRLFLTDAYPEDTTRARVTCLDACNGFKLWERAVGASRFTKVEGTKADDTIRAFQLPGRVLPGEMVATAGRLYLTDGPDCLILNAADGQEAARFKAPAPTHPSNCWRFVACLDDMLVGYADAPAAMPGVKPPATPPAGGPATLFALTLADGVPRWVRGGADGDAPGVSFGTPLAIGEGRIFVRADGTNLVALDTRTGKTAWQVSLGGETAPSSWWEGVVHRGRMILSMYNMRTWGDKKKLAALTFATADGRRLAEATNLASEVFLDSREGFLGPPAKPRLGCNYGSAAGPFHFHRNQYFVERTNAPPGAPGVPVSYGGVRAACGVGALPANGLVHVLPNGLGCGCAAYHATLTLEPGLEIETFATTNHPPPEEGARLAADEERPAAASDWPTYMADPSRSGVTRQSLDQPLAPAWEVRVAGEPTPCIVVGRRVFLGTTDEAVYALDASGGKTVWRFQTGGALRAAPAYWNGRIYAGCDDGWLYCLAARDGRLLWRLRGGPSARQQVAFESLISPWPLRHGLAVDDGCVYFSAGFLPGNEIYACAADARTGRVQWRTPLGKTSIIPTGHLVLTPLAVMYPSPGSAAIYHPIFLSRADGSRQGGGNTHGDFTDCRFVPGQAGDGAGYADGFALHGGSAGILRGYRAGVGYSGRPFIYPGNYDMYPLPAAAPGEKPADHPPFADGGSFLPLFAGGNVCFRQKSALVCVARTNIAACVGTRLQRGDERDGLLTWRASGLPCGEPEWLLAATGAGDGDAAVFVAGGTNGVAAVAAADGRVLWNAAWTGPTRPAAIAGGCLFVTFLDGRVKALKP